MVVYTMNERTRLKMDMESLLDSDNAPASREAGPRIKTLADARGVAEKIRARVRYDILGRDDVVELVYERVGREQRGRAGGERRACRVPKLIGVIA